MRRKVIQHFANVFCQRVVQLPEGYDLASFVYYGSGIYELNIISGECRFEGESIPKLRTCDVFNAWLLAQLDRHRISCESIEGAKLKIDVSVTEIKVDQSSGHKFASAHFSFDCESEIRTDEKSYQSRMSGAQAWGFDWYYNRLYGSVLALIE